MRNLDGESEWVVAERTDDQVVLEDERGATQWVLPADLLPERVDEGDVLNVVAEVVRSEAEEATGSEPEADGPAASRVDRPSAGEARDGGSVQALEEATHHLTSGALLDYRPGDAGPLGG